MKVLFVSRKYPPAKGGMELYCYNLISNYNDEKKVIVLGKKQIHLLWFLPYCFLYVLFNSKKYDVLYLGDMLMSIVGWGAKIFNHNIKVVATVHGLDITYDKKIYQWYLDKFSKNFDMYIPNSSYTQDIAKEKGYYPSQVIFPATLNGEISQEKYDTTRIKEKYNIKENEIIILTTGRLVKRKGVEWFIKNVLPAFKKEEYKYIVVGEGTNRENIENVINETKNNKVLLLGRISDIELREIYHIADVFIMPNIEVQNDVEGYGMVAVEAAAAGCIVVAANLQGILDAVVDGVTGYFVEHENEMAFIERLDDIFNNLQLYKEKTKVSQEYVYKYCTGVAIANKYQKIFQKITTQDSKN